jgi:6-methylsalicylate decarboxylase
MPQEWSAEAHLKMMDDLNITTSILSISTPGTHLIPENDALAIDLARKCNSYAAGLKKKHPGRFGFFAEVPLPNIDGALKEIEVAYSEGCDGIGLKTNYHGIYLGDARLDPIMEDLDRRNALVFVHPTTGCFCPAGTAGAGTKDAIKANPLKELIPAPVIEFFFDTARAITQLSLTGRLTKYSNITWIFPHAGGTMPGVLDRFTGFSRALKGQPGAMSMGENDVVSVFNERCYFDMAGWAFPRQWKMLVNGIGVGFDRLMYGTDFPFTNAHFVEQFAEGNDGYVEENEQWTEERQEMVWYGNAKKLFKL